jgi:hypothetical protein
VKAGPFGVSVAEVGREIGVRRHTDADGDVLTAEGLRRRSRLAPASRAATTSRSRRARSGRRRRLPASSRRSANQCRVASWSSQACGRRSRTGGAPRTKRRAAAGWRHYARPILSSSHRTRSDWAPRSAESSTTCPTAATPTSSATVRRTRPPYSASPRDRRAARKGRRRPRPDRQQRLSGRDHRLTVRALCCRSRAATTPHGQPNVPVMTSSAARSTAPTQPDPHRAHRQHG